MTRKVDGAGVVVVRDAVDQREDGVVGEMLLVSEQHEISSRRPI